MDVANKVQWALNHAMTYDAPGNDYDFIVKAILADLCDRQGLRHE